jgi:hypothetical protein
MTAGHHGPAWLAAYGLPGTLSDPPMGPLSGAGWAKLIRSAHAQQLSGHLMRAIDDGALQVTAEQQEQATDVHLSVTTETLAVEKSFVEAAGALAAAHVDVRVLRGPVLAHLDYPDPGLRPYHGVHLLVRSADISRAVAVLLANGCARSAAGPYGGSRLRLGRGVGLISPAGLRIDLDHTVAPGSLGLRVNRDQLWQHPGPPLVVGGVSVTTLDAAHRLLHVCYHAVLDQSTSRLVALRDVAQTLLGHAPDTAAVRTVAAAWRAEAATATAITWAWRALRLADVLALSAWAHDYRIDPRDERELLACAGPGGAGAPGPWAEAMAAPRLRDKAHCLVALARDRRFRVDPTPGNGVAS